MNKNNIEYINNYNKENYKNVALRIKPNDYDIINNYCKDMNISKQALFLNAVKYIINNDIPKSEYIKDIDV